MTAVESRSVESPPVAESSVASPAVESPPAASPVTRRPGPLRDRDFRLLWIGQTTSKFGSALTAVALPLVATITLDASTLQVALLSAAAWLPWLLIGLPAGAWIDRLPRRPVMVACDAVCLLLYLSVPVAAWFGVLTIGHLLAVALLAGSAAVFFQGAYHVYLPSLLDAERLTEGNARMAGSESVAQVAGPGMAGVVTQAFGAVTGLVGDAFSFLVSLLCLLRMRHAEARPRLAAPRRALRTEIAEGLRFVARDPYLRLLTIFGAAANLALEGYQSIIVVFLYREVRAGAGVIGALLAAMSVGGVIGAALASRVATRFGTGYGLMLCELATAPFALLIPLTGPGPRLALVAVGGLAVGAGVVAGNVIKTSFRQVYTPRHLLGRVVTSMQLLNYGTIPLGAVLGGALGTVVGLRPTIWVMSIGLVLSSLLLLTGPIRRGRELPVAPAATAYGSSTGES